MIAAAATVLVVAPLVGAVACFLRGGRFAAAVAGSTSAALFSAAAVLALAVWHDGPARVALGGWGAPLGIDWRADGLAALFLLATGGVCLGVALYAQPQLRATAGQAVADRFWPQMLLMMAAMNALFLSGDLFNLYVTLELATLAAVGFVALEGHAKVLAAAMRYLLVAMLGSLAYLLGVGLLYGAHGVLDIGLLAQVATGGPADVAALALMTAGLMAKGAFFPLHGWLPPAHGSAPAPASALLSGLVVKGPFYILLRLWLEVFGDIDLGAAAPQLVGACGAGAVVWGSLLALRQQRLKLLLAYSTVAQLGYLLVAVPLAAGAADNRALAGAVHLATSHAFAKAAMFMAAGAVIVALGHDRLAELRGTARHQPLTTFALALAGASLIGLPPSGGFIAKWLLLDAAIRSGQWWWVAIIVAGSLFAAGYVFKVLSRTLSARDAEEHAYAPAPLRLGGAALALALGAVVLGLAPAWPIAMILERTLQAGMP